MCTQYHVHECIHSTNYIPPNVSLARDPLTRRSYATESMTDTVAPILLVLYKHDLADHIVDTYA